MLLVASARSHRFLYVCWLLFRPYFVDSKIFFPLSCLFTLRITTSLFAAPHIFIKTTTKNKRNFGSIFSSKKLISACNNTISQNKKICIKFWAFFCTYTRLTQTLVPKSLDPIVQVEKAQEGGGGVSTSITCSF